MVDRVHGKSAVARPSRRYRLKTRQFEFRRVDGKLMEMNTGLLAVHSARSVIFGRRPEAVPNRPPHTIYLTDDGSPADPLSAFVLRQGMNDYLSFLACRLAPDIAPDDDQSDAARWERILETEGLPSDLPLLSPGGLGASPLERLDASRFESLRHRRSREGPPGRSPRVRPLQSIAPSEWRRAVVKRLALFFGRIARDPLIQRMAGYFCQTRNWNRWKYDPELEPLVHRWNTDDRLQRLLSIMERYTYWRAGIAAGQVTRRKPFRYSLIHPLGTFVFAFPSTDGRRDNRTKRAQWVRRIIVRTTPRLVDGPDFWKAWLAAAAYLGREYLEKPQSLAGAKITQDQVARRFGLTRRQLTHALHRMKAIGMSETGFQPVPATRRTSP